MDMSSVLRSLLFFIVAGVCEIGGGYLFWQWLRNGQSYWLALAGVALLILYGIVPTFQPVNFGRAYAAYGGIFVAMSVFWGWWIDDIRPDRFDLMGGGIAVLGCLVIMFWPR
jgi:small multidrug resistance family-3 protein